MQDFVLITEDIKNIISNDFFIGLILLSGVYFTIRLVFPQFRFAKQLKWALSDNAGSKDDGISPFQAFITALGARVGVGNVAGIASAIATGGPGAIFWIWIFGIFGSAISFLEGVLGQAYKLKDGDEFLGGAAWYIWRGFKNKKLSKAIGLLFAVIAVVSFGILMPGVQSNTVVNSIHQGFGADKTITIVVAAIFIALIIWGGIKSIGKIEAILTPIKCVAYLAFAAIVICYYGEYLGETFEAIITSALGINAVFGGIVGQAITMGVRRGIYSTDVAYGPGGTFAAAARCDHPVKQGILQALSVLLSTLLICTATALMVIQTGAGQIVAPNGDILYSGPSFPGTAAGAEWVQAALKSVPILEAWAPQVLAVMIAIFAVGTIIGFYYIIENNLRFIMGKTNKGAIFITKLVFLAALVISAVVDSSFIWNTADIGMGMLGWINIICLLFLSPKAVAIVKDFTNEIKAKEKPKFVPEKYGIDDSTGAWKN